jgi:hypothetical protein
VLCVRPDLFARPPARVKRGEADRCHCAPSSPIHSARAYMRCCPGSSHFSRLCLWRSSALVPHTSGPLCISALVHACCDTVQVCGALLACLLALVAVVCFGDWRHLACPFGEKLSLGPAIAHQPHRTDSQSFCTSPAKLSQWENQSDAGRPCSSSSRSRLHSLQLEHQPWTLQTVFTLELVPLPSKLRFA